MVHDSDHGGMLRTRDGGEQRVTPLELFFDLVYVFAITQLSHLLLDHLTVGGALETLFLLLAVWWAWVYTTWVANWFDPERLPVRLMLVAVMLASLVLWIIGGLLEGEARYVLWALALAVEYAGPVVGFYTLGLGRSTTETWRTVEGGHAAERCQLFVILALGESILVTGTTFGEIETSVATVAAFVVAFLGSVALWWIYF